MGFTKVYYEIVQNYVPCNSVNKVSLLEPIILNAFLFILPNMRRNLRNLDYMIFEVLMALKVSMFVFRVVTPG
jgi:hypothetical protein